MKFRNLPAGGVTLLCDVSNDGSVGSVVLRNTTLNTATVAYYNGTTPNVPINIMPHYHLYGQMAGNMGGFDQGRLPL